MADLLNTFSFEGKFPIRTIIRESDPWFVAADVCAVLELSNPSISVQALDEDERAISSDPKLNLGSAGCGPQSVNIISESGLYTLVLRSRKPQARPFRRWVTHEVLPAIRKRGAYVAPTADLQAVVQASMEALGWHPEWKQSPAEKLEQARKDSKGSYELLKGKVLPLLEQILAAEVVEEDPAARFKVDPTRAALADLLDRVVTTNMQIHNIKTALIPALQANHMMFHPIKTALDALLAAEDVRSGEKRSLADTTLHSIAIGALRGIMPNPGVEPAASIAGKMLAKAPRHPQVQYNR